MNPRAGLNHSSDRDVVNITSFNSSDHDYVLVRCNATSDNVICVNGTIFGDGRFPYMEYYYDEDDAGLDFFDIYYSTTRFAVETTMALLAMTLNVLEVGGKSELSSWSRSRLMTKPTLGKKTLAINDEEKPKQNSFSFIQRKQRQPTFDGQFLHVDSNVDRFYYKTRLVTKQKCQKLTKSDTNNSLTS